MTEYKTGDRVRITLIREGEVIDADQSRIWFQDDKYPMFPASIYPLSGQLATIEKLSDPEPAWVNGDVVRVPDDERSGENYTCLRATGVPWFAQDGGSVHAQYISRMWEQGDLEILYKADAEKVA